MLLCLIWLRVPDYHRLWYDFPNTSTRHFSTMSQSYNPARALRRLRFGLFPGRSPLLGESLVYFLFLQVLRCFSSLRLPSDLGQSDRPSDGQVVPFGNRRVKGYLHLTDAYRSLSRPSSPL